MLVYKRGKCWKMNRFSLVSSAQTISKIFSQLKEQKETRFFFLKLADNRDRRHRRESLVGIPPAVSFYRGIFMSSRSCGDRNAIIKTAEKSRNFQHRRRKRALHARQAHFISNPRVSRMARISIYEGDCEKTSLRPPPRCHNVLVSRWICKTAKSYLSSPSPPRLSFSLSVSPWINFTFPPRKRRYFPMKLATLQTNFSKICHLFTLEYIREWED